MQLLARPALVRKLGTLVTDGYLAQTGWVRSVLTGEIVDAEGRPLPWMTRPFIDFITPRLNPKMRIFEYGAGASTPYFARHAGEVVAVEHDASFAAALAPRLPANARVIHHPPASERYANSIAEMAPAPHIVIVDGVDRDVCAAAAARGCSANGVVVLDDAERPEYAPIYDAMRQAGFRELEFWGLAATRVEHRCTTVFYRSDNVLGIYSVLRPNEEIKR